MRHRAQHQAALLLRTRPYRESSLLIDAFTENYGRVSLIAKGARRLKSPVRGILKPFLPLLVSWSGKRDLFTMTGAEATEFPFDLREDRFFCAFYMNELLIRFMQPLDAHPRLFSYYKRSLRRLSEKHRDVETALRLFELILLTESGYGLLLNRDAASGDDIDPDGIYEYVIDQGPVATVASEGADSKLLLSGNTLINLHQGTIQEAHSLGECKRLLRAVLNRRLENRPLMCRQYAQQMSSRG